MADWLRAPEWAYLLRFLGDVEESATDALRKADPKNTLNIAVIQSELRFVRFFIDGDVSEGMLDALKKANNE